MRHPKYHEWLGHLFDHEPTEPGWYREDDAPTFNASDGEIVDFLGSVTLDDTLEGFASAFFEVANTPQGHKSTL